MRRAVYASPGAPLPALEMLVAEMLAIHFCSDREETIGVLTDLLAEAEARLRQGQFVVPEDAVRVFWVNPVADLRAMNLLEDWGGRICGSDYMFTHALDLIPEDLPPLEALARTALADPMVGSTLDRARRIVADCRACRAEAVVVSRIPGASHCAREGAIIREAVRADLGIPTIELEVPPISDAMLPTLSLAPASAAGNREGATLNLDIFYDLRRHRRRVAGDQSRAVRFRTVPHRWLRPGRSGRGTAAPGRRFVRTHLPGARNWTGPQSTPSSPPATAATPCDLPTRPLPRSPATPRASITWRPRPAPSSKSAARTASSSPWKTAAACGISP